MSTVTTSASPSLRRRALPKNPPPTASKPSRLSTVSDVTFGAASEGGSRRGSDVFMWVKESMRRISGMDDMLGSVSVKMEGVAPAAAELEQSQIFAWSNKFQVSFLQGSMEPISLKQMHLMGVTALAVFSVFLTMLLSYGDAEKTAAHFEQNPKLSFLYNTACAVFLSAVFLNCLAMYGAVTDEKRVLSGLEAYIDFIACISYFAMGNFNVGFGTNSEGQTVWVARMLQWSASCPLLLFWCFLVTRAPKRITALAIGADFLLIMGGILSNFLRPVPQTLLYVVNMGLFVFVMYSVTICVDRARSKQFKMSPALPSKALDLIRWEILFFWSLFPAIDVAYRSDLISFTTSECLLSAVDYVAKSGLAMIMMNCNLEQANSLKVKELVRIIDGIVTGGGGKKVVNKEMEKTVGKDVGSWLNESFAGGKSDEQRAKDEERAQRHKLNRKLLRVDPQEIASSELFSYDFDAFVMTEEELVAVVLRVFEELHLMEAFQLSSPKMRTWVVSVRSKYNETPFHNWRHAVTVFHTTYLFVSKTLLGKATDLELLAILVAALSHDLDHDGRTNSYHVNAGTEIALNYNDNSVLENHHASVGWNLLMKSRLLEPLEAGDLKVLRKHFVQAILGTDMTGHNAKLEDIKSINELGGFGDLAEDDAKRAMVLYIMLHTADLYTPIKAVPIAYKWAKSLQQEFNAQVAKEEEAGLPTLAFMKTSGDQALAKSEVGFISFVILPWWTELIKSFPTLGPIIPRIEANLANWKSML